MSRIVIAVVVILVAAGGLVLWDLVSMSTWDGLFDVPVTIWRGGKALKPEEVKRVSLSWRALPDVWDERGAQERPWWLRDAEVEGDHFVARVPCCGIDSGLGLRNRYSQPRSLYLEVQLKDGQTLRLQCPLADREHKPEIRIDVGGAEEDGPWSMR